MTRRALVTGFVLVAFSLAVFLYKTLLLGTPLVPSDPADLWQVELSISARGEGERGSLKAALPVTDGGQVVFDERSSADELSFSIRVKGGERTGVWSGRFDGVHKVVYGFRVKLTGGEPTTKTATTRTTTDEAKAPPPEIARVYLGDSVEYPVGEPEIKELLERIGLPPATDPAGRLRALQAYVAEEVAAVETASQDALLTLSQGEGSAAGKARLLVTLARAAGLPARLGTGLRLKEGSAPATEFFVEAYLHGAWLPLSASGELFGHRPKDLLVLKTSDGALVESTGVSATGHQFRARRERLRPEELAAVMVPTSPVLSALSLYRLPLSTQESLRLLLLLPVGALLVSAWRNLIGITTYGTFLPVLLALALRATSLTLGLFLVAVVLGVGIAGRMFVDRLRLLVVPRLSVLMCLVVLTMTALAVLGERLSERELFAGVVFPVVILTMVIERFSLTLAEEGSRNALKKAGFTVGVAVGIYPVFTSDVLAHLMFGFPELVVSIMGLLTFLGGYTGYRLVDFRRFRSLAQGPEEPAP